MFPIPVLTSEQAREWDRDAERAGLPLAALMESAGRGIAAVLVARWSAAARQGTLVAVGPGNNGGDGWVVARALEAAGLPVWVTTSGGTPSPLNALEAGLARRAGVREVEPDGPWPAVGVLVDAILGTGASGPLRPGVAALVARLAELELPVVAVDGPTGLDLDTGVSRSPLRADLTVTFGGYRRGHLLARDEVGDLVVVDIGFGPPAEAWPRFLTEREAARAAPALAAGAHKGARGRVVVIGGDAGMTGAARLAGRAAFAAGAGLVHVVAPAESVAVLAGAEPDLQTCISGFDRLSDSARALLERADAVVIGPGLGRAPGRATFLAEVAAASPAPTVIDADGLMAFSGNADGLAGFAAGRATVATPHAGEFRALFPGAAADLGVDPWSAARVAAARLGLTVLLKGVPTVVAGPAGGVVTVAAGNPGLATGGSGDTLAGTIGAWLAQGIEPSLAAAAAAQALGTAADLAARRGTARALRPMEVVAALPEVWRRWEQVRRDPAAPSLPVIHQLSAPIRT